MLATGIARLLLPQAARRLLHRLLGLCHFLLAGLRFAAARIARLPFRRLLRSLLHFLLHLARLVGKVILFAGHLVKNLGRQCGEAQRLVLQLGQGSFQIGEGRFFFLLSGLALSLL